jgi:hypothetical protein
LARASMSSDLFIGLLSQQKVVGIWLIRLFT